jgi:hypothetical protein
MQFKRPAAYPDYSSSKIITDRTKVGLRIQPRSLYFPLREKQKTHADYQHNVLYRLRQSLLISGSGDAAYVCPLFVDRSAYRLNLHWSGLRRWPRFWRDVPWELQDILLSNGDKTINFDQIPVLAEHITVPPHEPVTTAKHRYSFTEQGTDLCFHSPRALPEGAENLARFLTRISDGFLDGGQKIMREQADRTLSDLVQAVHPDRGTEGYSVRDEGDDPIGRWFAWGDHLHSEYAIEQYALVSWRE